MPNYKAVICPFYDSDARKAGEWKSCINCEHIKNNMGFEMKNSLKFRTREEMECYMEMFCANQRYYDCEYYKAIYLKYKERK